MENFGAFWALLFTVQLPVLHAKTGTLGLDKTCSNYMQCTAGTQKSKRQHMPVGNSRVKIITFDKVGGKCVCPRLSVCLSVSKISLLKSACMDWWIKCCVLTDVGTWTN